jgi:hypothetical protein
LNRIEPFRQRLDYLNGLGYEALLFPLQMADAPRLYG